MIKYKYEDGVLTVGPIEDTVERWYAGWVNFHFGQCISAGFDYFQCQEIHGVIAKLYELKRSEDRQMFDDPDSPFYWP